MRPDLLAHDVWDWWYGGSGLAGVAPLWAHTHAVLAYVSPIAALDVGGTVGYNNATMNAKNSDRNYNRQFLVVKVAYRMLLAIGKPNLQLIYLLMSLQRKYTMYSKL